MALDDLTLERIRNNTVTALNLTNKGLEGKAVSQLAEALAQNSSVTSITLAGNDIGDAGAKALAKMLRNNSTLREITLGSNRIGDAGAKALGAALGQNNSLRELSLGVNRISDEGARALAQGLAKNTSLSALSLEKNAIGDAGAAAFADGLQNNRSLIELSLHSNAITDTGAEALVGWVENHSTLAALELSRNAITPAGEALLAEAALQSRNPNLVQLSLGYSPPPPLSELLDQNARGLSVLAQRLHDNAHALTGEELRRIDTHLPAVLRTQYYANRASFSSHGTLQKEARYEAFLDGLPGLPPQGAGFVEALFTPAANGFAPLDNPRLWKDPQTAQELLEHISQDASLLSRRTPKGSSALDALASGQSKQHGAERPVVGSHTAKLSQKSHARTAELTR